MAQDYWMAKDGLLGDRFVHLFHRILSFCVLSTILVPTQAVASTNPLIQRKVVALLDRAETTLHQGKISESMACLEAVLLKPTITVSINTQNLGFVEQFEAIQTIRNACNTWEKALNNEVNFKFVSNAPADVRIQFNTEVAHAGQQVAGVAHWTRQVNQWGADNFSSYVSGDITIRTNLPNNQKLSQQAMQHTATHEFGHLLGLWDSPRIGDIMGPVRPDKPVTAPSDRELQALQETRQNAVYVLQACLTAAKN